MLVSLIDACIFPWLFTVWNQTVTFLYIPMGRIESFHQETKRLLLLSPHTVRFWFGLVQYASVRFGSGRFDYLLHFLYGSVQLRTTALISPRIGSVPDLGNSVLLHTIGQFFEKREEKNAVPPAVGRQKISVRTSKKKVAFCT